MSSDPFKDIFSFGFSDSPRSPRLPKLQAIIDSCPPSPRADLHMEPGFAMPLPPPEPDFTVPDPFFNEKLSLFFTPVNGSKKTYDENEDAKSATEAMQDLSLGKAKAKLERKGANKDKAVLAHDDKKEEEKKAIRAEKNRRFAKESRDRKRRYVQELEAEVKDLRKQVEFYKSRLSKYELIEKQRNMFGYELYATISGVYKEMYEKHQSVTDTALFVKALEKKFDQCVEERRKALEQLARTMV